MSKEYKPCSGLIKSSCGASLVEYVLLVTFIFLVVILAVQSMGTKVSEKFSTVGSGFGH